MRNRRHDSSAESIDLRQKHSDEGGIFALEGRLRFGQVFVGRWRMSATPDEIHGIFSMTKR